MKQITDKEFKKIEYLLGFVNDIAEMVLSPEEYLDPNTGDSTVYSLWLSEEDGKIKLSTLEDDSVKDFKETLHSIREEVRDVVNVDFTKQWEELR
jgi:hypothetical protein